MSQFPIIKYSQAVSNALYAVPPVSSAPLQQQLPNRNKPPAKVEKSLLLELVIIGATFLIFFRGFGVILAIAYACYRLYQSIEAYPKRLKIYEEQCRQQLVSQPVAPVIHTADIIRQFRQRLLFQTLKQTVTYDSVACEGRKGFREDEFKKYLVKYFGNSIFTEIQVKQPYSDRPYEPDFAYIDHQLGLHIDIEIDEPYAYKSLEPIHYRDFYYDNDRDNVFNSKGWVVIRFSEEQVVRQPHECCKVIAQVIHYLTNQLFFLNKFNFIGNLTSVAQWTEAEAEDMAREQYRDTYLKSKSPRLL